MFRNCKIELENQLYAVNLSCVFFFIFTLKGNILYGCIMHMSHLQMPFDDAFVHLGASTQNETSTFLQHVFYSFLSLIEPSCILTYLRGLMCAKH